MEVHDHIFYSFSVCFHLPRSFWKVLCAEESCLHSETGVWKKRSAKSGENGSEICVVGGETLRANRQKTVYVDVREFEMMLIVRNITQVEYE